MKICLLILLCTLNLFQLKAENLPREVVALYDSIEDKIQYTLTHRFIEMPLNHLGLVVNYYDINDGLPDIENNPNVRGVLACFNSGYILKEPLKYLQWAHSCIEKGKKFVILGGVGIQPNKNNEKPLEMALNTFFRKLGILPSDEWKAITFNLEIKQQNELIVDSERSLKGVYPPFRKTRVVNKQATSHLSVEIKKAKELYDLIA